MKKIILVLLVLLCSGCGKKLTCTYKQDYDDNIKIKNKIVFNFKDNTYKETDIMVFKEVDDASLYFADIEEYKDEYNLKLENNKIISNIEGKITNSKKTIKNKYESYDYKCK